ncbi:MAG TPA: PadR family transcriptional regulator [Solirubrobacterales bacterium]|nr:PadR family transcriptional regulator [Solirubrobacterales bacterium]
MPPKRKTSAQEAVAEAAGEAAGHYLREQREAAEVAEAAAAAVAAQPAGGRRRAGADPLAGNLRHELLPLLVLHYVAQGPTYGNQLIDRVTELTTGVVTVNPNTMYPLLRDFEKRGLIEGQWEHPERRSRRFYSLTADGKSELGRLREVAGEALDSLERTVGRIKGEIFP